MKTMHYVRATQNPKLASTLIGMPTRTGVRIGRIATNHNETLLGYKLRTGVKVGRMSVPEPPERNHNETLVGYKLRTGVKAGSVPDAPDRHTRNHNQTLLEDLCLPLCDACIDSRR
jgi:hypothetical protein